MAYGTPMQNQNKGYAAQEKKDLMSDNPIVKDASGGRSWMSKHSQSGYGSSPINQNAAAKKELARLERIKAEREARNAADDKKPKPKKQTKFQALKAKVKADLTRTEAEKPRSQS